ncbi:MAG: T9SS type A sorting domain-containing protein [Deltaproteobacteria bacterium]|nr:T9SS type A sorting domain-containing protein [Deltaproteobacteria bacterium]
MKTITFVSFIILISNLLFGQTIVIGEGASIYVPAGADICAGGEYGNITGNIFGEGTQCGDSPVPVELNSFTAIVKNNQVKLEWVTETEVNNYGFEVERSVAEDEWEMLKFIEGHGNSNSPKTYSYTDKSLNGGTKFKYRLKQIDTDGKYEYSEEIEVNIVPTIFALYQNYPNPFNPVTTIRYQLPKETKVVLKIYDILGAEVMVLVKENREAGVYEVNLNAQSLASGTYIYRIIAGEFVETKKMILLK